jgi:hypothetical protein
MIKRLVLSIFVLINVLSVWQPAFAQDYITDATQSLQNEPVYVHPSINGHIDKAAKLNQILRKDDRTLLIMLPEEAEDTADINTIVSRISNNLGDRYIIGLAVGYELVGYGPILPLGVATDQMRRADSVSNDPVTALITFAQNIHIWQNKNPMPEPTPTPKPTRTPRPAREFPLLKDRASPVFWVFWSVILFVAIGISVLTFLRAKSSLARRKRIRALDSVEKKIGDLREEIQSIKDWRISRDLNNALPIATGLLEMIRNSTKPRGYVEEKFPELIRNMIMQVRALKGHEQGNHPISEDTLNTLKRTLLSYDELFTKLQEDSPESNETLTSIIDSNNYIIQTLGYIPEDKSEKVK